MNRRQLLAALVVAVAAGVGALLWELGSASETTAVSLPRVAWPAGQRAVYRIDVASSDDVVPMAGATPGGAVATGATLSSQFALRGELTVEDRGPAASGAGRTVAVRVRRCDDGALVVAGTSAWNGAEDCQAVFANALLLADIAPSGRVLELREPRSQDRLAASLLQYLVLELQVDISERRVAAGESWQAKEPALAGTLLHEYRLLGRGDDGDWSLERSLTGATDLSAARSLESAPAVRAGGSHRVTLSNEGLLLSMDGDRELEGTDGTRGKVMASRAAVGLTFVRLEPVGTPASMPKDLVARAPTEPRTGSEADRQILDARIAGLTRDDMNRSFLEYGNAGQFPDHNRFLWRVTGYLERHPEHARDLLALYRRPEASHKLHALVLDVLASVGHPVAQDVMREALAGDEVLEGARGRRLYQRLGLVEQPTVATATAVETDYLQRRDSDGLDPRLATAYSLGAIAGKLGQDESERAAQYRQWLAEDLASAASPTEQMHFVRALGNAGGDDLADTLGPYASSDSASVRAAVARALARADAPGSGDLMRELLSDDDAVVQREALRAPVASHDAASLEALAAVARTGGLDRLNVRRLLDIVARARGEWPRESAAIVEALLSRGIEDPQLLAVAMRLR